MGKVEFAIAVKETPTFKSFPNYKKNVFKNWNYTTQLHNRYLQAVNHGIDNIKNNPSVTVSEVKIIEDVLKTQANG